MLEEDHHNTLKYINYLPNRCKKDKRVIVNSLKKYPTYYHYFSKLLDDKDFAAEIIEEVPTIYSLLNNHYGGINNKKFMMAYLIGSAKNTLIEEPGVFFIT